jgi:hypothetical protein
MSYAGAERIYASPCREGSHQKTFSGFCHVCGTETMSDGYSVTYHETQTLQKELNKLREENERLLRIKELYDREHAAHDLDHPAAG